MALTVTHAKVNNIADWTQADLDAAIEVGQFPTGTTLADITLASDWNSNHSVSGTIDISDVSGLQSALDGKVEANAPITGATNTKITYDANGLVTAGEAATTADIADSTNRRYVTDAQLVVIGNTSGTNTGNQTSIVGITGTKAQFDTAVTDGNFLYVGDVTQYTDEMAQDAVGAMINTSLTYVDGTPSLGLTSRTINGTAFDGTANITITAAAGTLTGTTLNATVVTSSLTSVGSQAQDLNMNSHKVTNVTDPTSAQDAATKSYVDSAVTGLLDYRGSYDASTNLFPATGGSGLLGAILKGDFWICSVAGTLGGESVTAGDLIISIVDTPGQTASNWDLIEHNIGAYVSDVTGTSNRITSTGGSTPQIDISASYVGQTSITTLGTIGTGTWQGTAVANNFITNTLTGKTYNGVTLTAAGSATDFLNAQGNYVSVSSGSGDVVGPASATDNAITRYDGATGKLIKDSLVIIDDLGNVTTPESMDAQAIYGFGVGLKFGSFYLNMLYDGSSLTANRTLGFDTQDGTRTVTIPGDATISGINTGDQTSVSGNAGTVTTINGRLTNGTGTTLGGSGTAGAPYTVNVNTTQSIAKLSNLTSNGIVTTSGGDGTLSVTATTGSGNVVLATSPALVTPDLGTPSAAVLTNATGLPIVGGTTGTLSVARGGTGLTAGTSGGVLYYSASGTLASSAALGSGQLILGGGAGSAPVSAAFGTANQTFGMNAAATAFEYKTNTGTANRITMTNGVGTYTWDIAATYVGQTSITTLGTITTGTWNGTDIAVSDGGTGRSTGTTAYSLIATGTTATGAQQTLANAATTEILVGGGASALPVWTTATGSGAPVRATSPTLVTPALGTPSSGNLSNCTSYPAATTSAQGISELATDAEVQTGTDTARVAPVSSMGYHQGAAKAWVKFDASSGTPTISDSYNVTSITDNGVGDFTINFTTAFANANYAWALSGRPINAGEAYIAYLERTSTPATGSFRMITSRIASSVVPADHVHNTAIFYGDW
jgi:hypothetical protein